MSLPPLRVGNASGFYGDRFDAVREMLDGGPLDVLTGDYLAELTMLILGRDRARDPRRGYARTFLRQLEDTLGSAVANGVRIVTNAGGLNPAGLADAVRELADRVGVRVRVAHVAGDDLTERGDPTGGGGWGDGVLAANAYLGGGGITACLRAGADVVVTGRVTDAALVTGAAAAHFGWGTAAGADPDAGAATGGSGGGAGGSGGADGQADLDALAGAVVAGHVLECGTQATGGNYAFFTELTELTGLAARSGHGLRRPGFPIAELAADGSCVITKHPGTGGAVTVDTVTAQLLYETAGARYLGPDVTARLDTVRLTQQGPDRVRIDGVRGEPPPPTLKVGLSRLAGWRNEVVFVLTGLDIEAKAALVRDQVEAALEGRRPAEVRWTLARTDRPDADVQEEASALLRLTVRDPDQEAVGRAVSGAAIELALASYPGFHVTAPPGRGTPYGVFEARYVPADTVPHTAVLPDGTRLAIPPVRAGAAEPAAGGDAEPAARGDAEPIAVEPPAVEPAAAGSPAVEPAARAAVEPAAPGGAEPAAVPTGPVPTSPGTTAAPAAQGPTHPALPHLAPAAGTGAPAGTADAPGTPGTHPTLPAFALPPEPQAPLAQAPLAQAPPAPGPRAAEPPPPEPALPAPLPPGPVRRAPLGRVAGARSGDKGGAANVGVWVRGDPAWRWLAHELTVDRFRELLPETAALPVTRHVLPNLRALNFVVDGLLGEGVAAQARFDPQAKAVGEWLRSRCLDIPEVLL